MECFRPACEEFACIAVARTASLHKTRRKELEVMTKEELTVLPTSQDKLIAAAMQTLHRTERHYNLDREACERQIDCVLLQKQEQKVDWPAVYWSSILVVRERNLDGIRRAYPAVVLAILSIRVC